jgi:hypothetical protein
MKKILIAGALTLMCSSAFAQTTTGPANQGDTMNKPGMTNGTMDKGTMDKGSMNNTTGMSGDMKNNPKKEMSKDGSPAAGSKDMKK